MPSGSPTHEVLRLAEAARLYGRSAVRWSVADGRWQQPHPRVIVSHNGPLSPEDEMRIVVAAGPPGTLLAGPTASALWGLRGFETPGEIHVLIPHHARAFAHPGAVLHRSIAMANESGVGDPARTSVERSVIDTASWCFSPRGCRLIVLAAVQQRVTTVVRLGDSLAERGPIRHAKVLRECLLDAQGGIDSLPEHDFARLVRDHGLPEPRRQVRVRGLGGSYFLDAEFQPWRVTVEIDGAHHRDAVQSEADLRRQNELVIGGRSVLRFSSYQVRHEPGSVARAVRRALVAAGWRPGATP